MDNSGSALLQRFQRELTGLAALLLMAASLAAVRAGDPLPAGALVRLGTSRRPPRNVPPERSSAEAVFFLGLAADGRLITAGGDSIRFWDIQTEEESGRLDRHRPLAVRLSPDGKLLARASSIGLMNRSYHIGIWDTDSGEQIADLDAGASLADMTFAPDGRTLAFGGGAQNEIQLWDTSRRGFRRIKTDDLDPRLNFSVLCLAFSADGKKLAAGTRLSLDLWEAATGKRLHQLTKDDNVHLNAQVMYSPDGQRLASWGEKHPIRVWDTRTGNQVCSIGGRNLYPRVPRLFSSDGRYLAAVGPENTLFLYDPQSGEQVQRLPGPRRMVFRNRPSIWSNRDWSSDLCDVAFSSDGKTLAAEQKDGSIRLWEVATGEERRRFAGHEDGVRALAFLRGDRLLVSGGEDGTAMIWDATGLGGGLKNKELSAKELDALWTDLAGKAAPAYRAMWQLARAPKQSVPYLAEKLKEALPPQQRRMSRAVEALEHAGTAEARRVLQTLANGAASPMTKEAQAAVRRLAKRPAAKP